MCVWWTGGVPVCLGSVAEEVLNPGVGKWGASQVRQFADQDVRDDSVKSRAVVNEEHPDTLWNSPGVPGGSAR